MDYIISNRDFIVNVTTSDVIPQIRFERLEKLLEILSNVPDKKFRLDRWGVTTDKETTCVTAACAAGCGANTPAFQKLGLHLKKDTYRSSFGEQTYFEIVYTPKLERDKKITKALYNDSETVEDFDACAAFFGLTHNEAWFLFNPDSYVETDPTRKRVMKRITRFIKEGRKDRLKLSNTYLYDKQNW